MLKNHKKTNKNHEIEMNNHNYKAIIIGGGATAEVFLAYFN